MGTAVDWAAEARRAVQAFDIRSHLPASNQSVSGSPAEDHWWPRRQHHAGDQFKTANGDWIVWINDSCYQLTGPVPEHFGAGQRSDVPGLLYTGQPELHSRAIRIGPEDCTERQDMNDSKALLTTTQKALTINLDVPKYGTFAEIGAGQEVAREFFQAGGASGDHRQVHLGL